MWSHIKIIESRNDRPGIGAPDGGVADIGNWNLSVDCSRRTVLPAGAGFRPTSMGRKQSVPQKHHFSLQVSPMNILK